MNFSKEQTNAAKGISIFLIFLYNFVRHFIGGGEGNEMFFDIDNVDSFTSNVISPWFFVYIIGYLGWIGVPVFVFLSGYGLGKKYDNTDIHLYDFIKNHLFKLWKLLLPLFFMYVVTDFLLFDNHTSIYAICCQVTLLVNILDYHAIIPRPYWFFGAIFQFYTLFFIIRRLKNKHLYIIAFLGLFANYFRIYFTSIETSSMMRYNFIGWVAPFAFGMICARTDFNLTKNNNIICFIIAIVCLMISSLFKPLTPLTDLFIIAVVISFVQLADFKVLSYIGVISSSIFVIHPYVRLLMYHFPGCDDNAILITILYILIVLMISILHNRILNLIGQKKSASI